jgi:hypothetical protein
MDFEGLLQSVVRFSNFMTSRLVVSGLVFYVIAGFTDIGSSSEGLLPNLDLMNNVVDNYQSIFNILGVSEFALLLIFFIFVTAIHLCYVIFERIGGYIPPAIVPLSGWDAIKDLTEPTFQILREARGEEHTEEENQRLFEFSRKLEALDAANEKKYAEALQTTYEVFNVSKTFIVFAVGAWLYALVSGRYVGDPVFILVILSLAVATALITALAIFREHHDRIEELRTQVTHQLLGFASIWLPTDDQQRVAAACVPSSDLRAANFEILMPVYGTMDAFVADVRRFRERRKRRAPSAAAPIQKPTDPGLP